MPRLDAHRDCPNVRLVIDPRRIGATVGVYADYEFSEVVADYFGRHFVYAGVAPRLRNGRYDLKALHVGEFIVQPGLLYRIVPTGHSAGLRHFAGPPLQLTADTDKRPHEPAIDLHALKRRLWAKLPVQNRKDRREIIVSFAAFLSFVVFAHLLLTVLNIG